MSGSTFLLILAAVVVVFLGFVIKSWFELSNVTRSRKRGNGGPQDEDDDGER